MLPTTSSGAFCSRLVSRTSYLQSSIAGRNAPSAKLCKRAAETDAKLKRLYDAIENGIADLADPMLKDRIAELKAIRDPARAGAERADGASDRLGPAITPAALKTFARTTRRRMRTESGRRSGPISMPRSTNKHETASPFRKTGARQTFATLACFVTAGAASLSADQRRKGPRCAAGLRRGIGPL